MVGYSRLMAADEAGTIERQKAHRSALIDPKIDQYGGRIVKSTGDGVLVEFPSVVDAVQCAIEIQRLMPERENRVPQAQRISYRIGINLGDIVFDAGDIFGDGVNIAARLEGISEAGGVCISDVVRQNIHGKLGDAFQDKGEVALKNMTRQIRAWQWIREERKEVGQKASDTLALPDKPSIAVLPFSNMSAEPEQDYFADGITEDIITALSGFGSIFVIARNSSFAFKGHEKDIKQIGNELGIRYVLEGSVRRSTSRFRITAQLIEVEGGNHLWAQRYDRVLEDVFELQDEITGTIVAAIEPELENAERERARAKSPENLDAWESYQRGMWHTYKLNREDAEAAVICFRQALAGAPNYAPALTGLAYLTFQKVIFNFEPQEPKEREQLLAQGIREATAAVQADDRSSFARYVLGRLLALDGDFENAIEQLELAISLNPNSALAHHGLGAALATGGRPAESLAEFEAAARLSPLDLYRWAFSTMHSFALVLLGRYEEAISWGRKGIRDNPKVFWPYAHVVSAAGLGGSEDAALALDALLRVKPDFSLITVDQTVRLKNVEDREHYIKGLRLAGLKN
jgi:adenylate cyclase